MADTARALIEQLLAPLPDTHVVGYLSAAPENPARRTAIVSIEKVTPGATSGYRGYEFGLLLVVPETKAQGADDRLDAFLDDVLDLLDATDPGVSLAWTEAARSTWRTKYPAYLITVTTTADLTQE